MLFCAVLIRISVQFCGVRTPLTPPSVTSFIRLYLKNIYIAQLPLAFLELITPSTLMKYHKFNQNLVTMSYTIFIKRYETFFQEFLFLFEEFSHILWCFDKIFPSTPAPPSEGPIFWHPFWNCPECSNEHLCQVWCLYAIEHKKNR